MAHTSESRWKKIGNWYWAYFDNKGNPKITIGPDYWFTIVMVIFVLIFEAIAFSTIAIIAKDYLVAQLSGYLLATLLFGKKSS